MDSLISRQAAIEALSHGEGCGHVCRNAIKRIPSVPAVLVVRCTACRNWNRESGLTARMCSHWGKFTKQFDYCSYGEEQNEAD